MLIHPTRSELATLAKYLNLPTIPPTAFLSALIDVYTEYPDVEYEDILRDIANCYLEYYDDITWLDDSIEASKRGEKDSSCIRRIISGDNTKSADTIYGYLYYNDGNYETCVAIY